MAGVISQFPDVDALEKQPYFGAANNTVVNTIIALFPARWENLPESENSFIRMGWRWTYILNNHFLEEKAVLLNSMMDDEPDAFPAVWRRFIRVGSSLPEQVANVFELFYEKQYDRLVFAETICAALHPNDIAAFIAKGEKTELVLMPAEDGSIVMASMHMHLFPEWEFFRFHAEGAVVELISECHAKNISYFLFDSLNTKAAAANLIPLLQKAARPEKR